MLRRIYEHRSDEVPAFTSKYEIHRLVYFEQLEDIRQAISREKELKCWVRRWKFQLIESVNPAWTDLSLE
jgi:putative endonuclease